LRLRTPSENGNSFICGIIIITHNVYGKHTLMWGRDTLILQLKTVV